VATQTEYWLRGSVEGVPALLQPVAHALLQARDEVEQAINGLPEELTWERPAGVASVGFHLQHLAGVLDRLFTYAKGQQLSNQQLEYLSAEGKENMDMRLQSLFDHFVQQVDKSIGELKTFDETILTDVRGVGRKQVPSTVIGLLFHSAEHTMRHTGQLLVTIRMLKS
jgi:uncharacterized damage-inducible protein DinB